MRTATTAPSVTCCASPRAWTRWSSARARSRARCERRSRSRTRKGASAPCSRERSATRSTPGVGLDTAVPPDVDPRVGGLRGVRLHNIDALERVAAANPNGRRVEARRADAIVDEELRRFACHVSYRRARNHQAPLEQSADAW